MNIFDNPEKLEKLAEILEKNPELYHVIFKENIASLTGKAVDLTEKANTYIYDIWKKTNEDVVVGKKLENVERDIIAEIQKEGSSIKGEISKVEINLKSTIVETGKATSKAVADVVGEHEKSSQERHEIGKRYVEGLSVKVGGIGKLIESKTDEIKEKIEVEHTITRYVEIEDAIKKFEIDSEDINNARTFLKEVRNMRGGHRKEEPSYEHFLGVRKNILKEGYLDEEILEGIEKNEIDKDYEKNGIFVYRSNKSVEQGTEMVREYLIDKTAKKWKIVPTTYFFEWAESKHQF